MRNRKTKSITLAESILDKALEEAKKQNLSFSRYIENLLIKEQKKSSKQGKSE